MSATAVPAMTSSGQPVIILKEGTTETKGREAQKNNIMAAKLIADVIKSSLGPRGMDKMLVDSLGDVTITNDGATILKEIDVQHPAAKMMVEISKTTDNEVGDGTTSAVILAGALLERAEDLISKDVHPTVIVDGYGNAAKKALEVLERVAIKVSPTDRQSLIKIAKTAMATKLVAEESDQMAKLVVDAILSVAEKVGTSYKVDIDDVKVEKKPGGFLADTRLIKGILLDKEVVHGGMPKRVDNAKIALINSPLEIEKTEFSAEIRISNPDQMKKFLDEENNMLKDMVDKLVHVGANVVVCQKGLDDIAQHYLAKANILTVRRVKEGDVAKLAKATGGRIVTNLEDLSKNDLGNASRVEERKVEDDKWIFIEGCKNPKAVTIFIRGGTQRIVDEGDRSIHDALMVVKDVIENPRIVAGGGAVESQIAHELMEWSNSLSGREQLAVQKYSEAIETIPLLLAENAGMDPLDTQVELRAAHSKKKIWYGVAVLDGKVADMQLKNVIEPAKVKEQIIKSATEAANMILRIDDVIASSKGSGGSGGPPPGGPGGMAGGM